MQLLAGVGRPERLAGAGRRAVVFLATFSMWTGTGLRLAQALPAQVTDSTSTVHGMVAIRVEMNRVGLIAMPGTRPDSVSLFAVSKGLSNLIQLSPAVSVYAIGDTLSKIDLAAFARNLKVGAPPWLANTGVVVLTGRQGTDRVIATDRFIAQFLPGVTPAQIRALNQAHGVRILEANVLKPNHYLLTVTEQSTLDAISMANLYLRSGLTKYSHPDWVRVLRFNQFTPTDPLFVDQWYDENTRQVIPTGTGQASRLEDADIDASRAWDIARHVTGNPDVVIAVIDGGFDLGHPDLSGVWTDARRDYSPCETAPGDNCWDGDPSPPGDQCPVRGDDHGTQVAGLVGAGWNNGIGIAGTCPHAKLMPIRIWGGIGEEHLSQAFQYAKDNGARVINNSWGYRDWTLETNTLADEISALVAPGDGSDGIVVLFAMDYLPDTGGCEESDDRVLANVPNVIAVGASSDEDRRLPEVSCGDFVSILAPSYRGTTKVGTLNLATTDITTANPDKSSTLKNCGYNDYLGRWLKDSYCPEGLETDDTNYTYCFGGTSGATPIVAGVAGMILSVAPDLKPDQVKRLLQDTADKIENTEASYGEATGFSSPSPSPTDPYHESTHGYGRVNAFEAVRVAAPASAGGKDGVDLFLRDNALDWGNTEQPSNVNFEPTSLTGTDLSRGFIAHWASMDVKVDAPSFQTSSTPDSKGFDGLVDENPVASVENHVFVRVHNRGPKNANEVKVRLYWAYVGAATPSLPSDFWTGFAANTFTETDWHFIGEATRTPDVTRDPCDAYPTGAAALSVSYSGATAAKEARASASLAPDGAVILPFCWTAPTPGSGPDHYCLLAIVDGPEDHVSPYKKILDGGSPADPEDFDIDELTPSDNNVSHRNYQVMYSDAGTSFETPFYVRNPFPMTRTYVLRATPGPSVWKVQFKWPPGKGGTLRGPGPHITLEPHESKLIAVVVNTKAKRATGTVVIQQEQLLDSAQGTAQAKKPTKVLGGLTLNFRPRKPGEQE